MSDWLAGPHELVREELEAADGFLREWASSPVEQLAAVCQHVLGNGGKRIRPMALALSARAVGPLEAAGFRRVALFAAAIETVHVASLLHDDVVDHSSLRRGRQTANAIWGDPIAIFAADYLYSVVFAYLAEPENTPLLARISRAVAEMCEGEVLQTTAAGDTSMTKERYLGVVERKTGALMDAACWIGASVAGASDEVAESLAAFGRRFGTAFQITDDMLDLTGTEGEVGKLVGADLRGGRLTLPVIALRDRLDGDARDELLLLLGRREALDDSDVKRIAALASSTGALEYCRREALSVVRTAIQGLDGLDLSPARAALAELAEGLLSRRA